MAYGDYQQPGFKPPPQPGELDQPIDPMGMDPQPDPSQPPSPAGPVDQSTALQQVQQAYMTPNPLTVGRGLEIAQPGGQAPSAGAGGYTPGMGAQQFLGDFLSKQAATPSLSDSSLQPIVSAGRFADQRNADRQRAALAEQLGGAGLGSSGAMNVGQGKIRQQQGETQALRESGLLQDETNARRANLLAGLGQDASRYQFDQGAGIQLAQLEALLNGQAVQPFLGGY